MIESNLEIDAIVERIGSAMLCILAWLQLISAQFAKDQQHVGFIVIGVSVVTVAVLMISWLRCAATVL